MPQNTLAVVVCSDARDAAMKGFDWAAAPDIYSAATIEQVVVVRKGTESGKPTVDLLIRTNDGKQHVVMLTGALIKMIPC